MSDKSCFETLLIIFEPPGSTLRRSAGNAVKRHTRPLLLHHNWKSAETVISDSNNKGLTSKEIPGQFAGDSLQFDGFSFSKRNLSTPLVEA